VTSLEIASLAITAGIAHVLPLSASGHDVVLRIWLELGASARLAPITTFAVVAAITVSVRARLWPMLGEGLRAVARPALFTTSRGAQDAVAIAVASATSIAFTAVLRPMVVAWAHAPVAAGLGLLATAVALGSTAVAPLGKDERPGIAGALLTGCAHGLSFIPGASPMAGALVCLIWLGVRPLRAVEVSLLVSAPALLIDGLAQLTEPGASSVQLPALPVVVAASLLSFAAALLAAAALRRITTGRRLPWLALWLTPVGLATLAYAQALDDLPVQ